MTTIACGGGPKLEQRRAFAALRDGTHVPGYRGYCPQIKYRVGKTYGTDTHLLAKDTIHRHPSSILAVSQPSAPISNLPDATGDNKYTQSMVPGYTGYIPRMPFKFGNTYKEDCDVCIDQFITARKFSDSKATDLRRQIGGYPRLTSISHDPDVRDKLNMYRDTHPTKPILVEDKRGFLEPPIPGYKGFIPRIKSTEQGLGCRYHRSTQNGLELFVQETAGHAQRHGAAIPQSIQSVAEGSMGFKDSRSAPPGSNRLYKNDGMIPKYTGYIPQRRFNFGNTYGDTTRTLPVCAHNNVNFGDFVRSNTFA